MKNQPRIQFPVSVSGGTGMPIFSLEKKGFSLVLRNRGFYSSCDCYAYIDWLPNLVPVFQITRSKTEINCIFSDFPAL